MILLGGISAEVAEDGTFKILGKIVKDEAKPSSTGKSTIIFATNGYSWLPNNIGISVMIIKTEGKKGKK